MPTATLDGYRCERCGYQWVPRTARKPTLCASPKCKSPYWDRPRQKPQEAD